MQPNYSSIGQIFSAQTRYTVPLFQRPYVWSKEEQWQPLWDDIRSLANRVLNPPAHKPVAGHFLGTVVLEQVKTTAIAMPQRQVIDGQQRLTTLQIALKAAEHALIAAASTAGDEEKASYNLAAGQISQLSSNQFAQHPEEVYKVWPTNDDRAPFTAVMNSNADSPIAAAESRMADAYCYFREAISTWLQHARAAGPALALASALKDHLRLIVLDLDENDEPQAIFETLNAHGTPLLPADLIKNWLLWQGTRQELNAQSLYDAHWAAFDRNHAYWRKTVGTGHAARPRVDTFLQNWLIVEVSEIVPVKHLYDRFLAHATVAAAGDLADLDVPGLMAQISRFAAHYRRVDAPSGDSPLDRILRRLNRLDFVVFRPVLMALMDRAENAGGALDDLASGAAALESFLIRRMVCNLQTRGYGALAIELVRVVKAVPPSAPAASALQTALNATAGEWPDDEQFEQNWLSRPFYGWFRRDRVAMLLEALEEQARADSKLLEPIVAYDFSKTQIEHVMPQSWATHWPLPTHISALEREGRIQNIGNLTLVSERLNPTLSNGPWDAENGAACKRALLSKYTTLVLNKELLEQAAGGWDEQGISNRAKALLGRAKRLWAAPEQKVEA